MIHVVLYEPEIPQNTGNIMRTCMAFNCKLHIIEPTGFSLDDKHLKRAGMDYIQELDWNTYPNWEAFMKENSGKMYYVTRYADKAPSDFDFSSVQEDIYLVFGKESTGIPKDILKAHTDTIIRIPMVKDARSLNLSNCVALMTYEVLRQRNYEGLSRTEVIKGSDFLEKYPEHTK